MAAATAPYVTREELEESLQQRGVTLLELIEAVGSTSADDNEIVATVISMLRNGRVRLCGSFRDEPVSEIARDARRD